MLPKLHVRMDRFEQVPAALIHIAAVVENWKPFWDEVFVPTYLADVRRNIDEEGELVKGGWKPTTKEYEDWKQRVTGSDRMGVFSGMMYANMDAGAGIDVRSNKQSLEMHLTDRTGRYFNAERRLFPTLQELGLPRYRQLLNDWLEFKLGPELGKGRVDSPDLGVLPIPRGGARMARKPGPRSAIRGLGTGKPKRKYKTSEKTLAATQKARAGKAAKAGERKERAAAASQAKAARKSLLKMAAERYKLYKTPQDQDYAFGGGKKKKRKNYYFDLEP